MVISSALLLVLNGVARLSLALTFLRQRGDLDGSATALHLVFRGSAWPSTALLSVLRCCWRSWVWI